MKGGFLVRDGWLAPEPLARLRAFLRGHRWFTVLKDGKRGPAGTIDDLKEGIDAGKYRLLGGRFVARRAVDGPAGDQLPYPSGTPLDDVLDSVWAELAALEPWLGRPATDWHRLGAGPRLYPAGGGMAEHDDADSFGTFALYAHDDWRDGWGGELEIDGERLRPAPNRCVFVKGGTPHRVLPVAEGRLRLSVIGYTRKPKKP